MSPALRNSSRSMSGTTRMTAYENGLRDGATLDLDASALGLADPRPPRLEPRGEVAPVGVALGIRPGEARVAQPLVGDGIDDSNERLGPQPRREPRIGVRDGSGVRQEHVL